MMKFITLVAVTVVGFTLVVRARSRRRARNSAVLEADARALERLEDEGGAGAPGGFA